MNDRILGSFFGLAVGDSLGFPLEFKSRGSFSPLTEYHGDGVWTDDTAMALCLAKSLTQKKGMDLQDQIELYLKWYHGDDEFYGGHVDCGMTVMDALQAYKRFGNPRAGATDEMSSGNGSIMRLGPVPIFFRHDLKAAVAACEESSRTTHQSQMCLDACKYFGALIWGALNGASKLELLEPYYPSREFWRGTQFDPRIGAIIEGSFKGDEEPDSTGFVVHTLKAALWAFHKTTSFKEGALLAVNLGGDADTTGAVYGQLAGAFYGLKGIPEDWVQILRKLPMLESMILELEMASTL